MNNPIIELWFLKIKSLIADKEMEVALANRELPLGGWQSDHVGAVKMINDEIESYEKQINKYS